MSQPVIVETSPATPGLRDPVARAVCALPIAIAPALLFYFGLIPNVVPTGLFLAGCLGVSALAAWLCPLRVVLGVAIAGSCFGTVLAGADLIWRLRPPAQFYYRPDEMFLHHWQPMPTLARYDTNVNYAGRTYGDLAAMAARPDWREYRPITFRSDSAGFPNAQSPSAGVDTILIGDSYGAGTGTRREATWAVLLQSRYHLNLYNLSIPESGPWHEMMNLKIMAPSLPRAKRTVVLWAFFTGNDLDDDCWDQLEPVLANGFFSRLRVSLATFRNRSPIFQLADHIAKGPPEQRAIEKYAAPGRRILFRPAYARRARRTLEEVEHHEHYATMLAVFRSMRDFAARQNLTIAVALLPSKEEVYAQLLDGEPGATRSSRPSALSVVVERESRLDGFAFLDLKPFFVAEAARRLAADGQLMWWSDDTHWNERGHAFAADVVFNRLLQPLLNGSH
jgi:hypothetical protein